MTRSVPQRCLLVATTNRKKLEELEDALAGLGLTLVSLGAVADPPDVEETGSTFEENADRKAAILSRHSGLWTLADDSGLEVDALGGLPGVRSARFASDGRHNATDSENRDKLLTELRGVPAAARTARFQCAISVAKDGAVRLRAHGTAEGTILTEGRGSLGFGYDPLFVPRGDSRTFAEMPPAEKRSVSHRARAIEAIRGPLARLLETSSP